MWALACMAQSLPANNSTHALRVLLVTCLVYVECVHGAYLLLPSAGCCKLWDLWFAACSLHTAQQLLVDHFVARHFISCLRIERCQLCQSI